jgi:ferrous iron transport protein A
MCAKSIAAAAGQTSFLNQYAVGRRVRITAINGDRMLSRRLLSLGLRIGSELEILHHRGRGVVVGSSGNRVALGAGVADKLIVTPLEAAE